MGFARQSRLRTTCSAVQKNYHSAAFSGGGGGGGDGGCDLLLPRGLTIAWQRSGHCFCRGRQLGFGKGARR